MQDSRTHNTLEVWLSREEQRLASRGLGASSSRVWVCLAPVVGFLGRLRELMH